MIAFFAEYGLFLLKTLTITSAIMLIVMVLVNSVVRARRAGGAGSGDQGEIEVYKFNERLADMRDALTFSLLDPGARKLAAKEKRSADKAKRKAAKQAAKRAKKQRGKDEIVTPDKTRRRVYVLDFDGDIRASAVNSLRREITALLTTATPDDEVVIRLESSGGMVAPYGLGASQLDRIRQKKIPLTICVDKVAASGGYMMACVGDQLVAAPFAVLGSIGVVAQIPNFHRLLKEMKIDFELLTAGKFKRTLTLFGENTDAGREKFIEDIERIHAQFKLHVDTYRPALDIETVATGEIWSGQDVLDLNLADRLATSDEYLVEASEDRDVFMIAYKEKRHLMDRFSLGVEALIDRLLMRWVNRVLKSQHFVG